jgi:PIN domain nuclease of toxin-antitoxin system
MGGGVEVSVLLDTHVLLFWLSGSGSLTAVQERAVSAASPDAPLLVSDISLWEVAMLSSRGRIALRLPLRDWLEAAVAPPLVRRVSISPAVAAEAASFPASFPRDPADRIIVASARVAGASLATQDQRIIDSGVVPTL